MPELIDQLAGYINPPVMQDAVIAYARQLDAPFTIGEIYRPLGLSRMVVQRVLRRLVKRGVMTRRSIHEPRPYHHERLRVVMLGKPADMWLYSLVEGST